MYDLDYGALLDEDSNAQFTADAQTGVIPCQHGWEYDLTEVPSSIVIDVTSTTF